MPELDDELECGAAECLRLRVELAAAQRAAHVWEERFRTVLGQSIDVIYRRDLKTDRYDFLSPAVERVTGFTAEEFAAMTFVEIMQQIHPDDRAVVERRAQEFERSRNGVPVEGFFEYRLRRKDGTYRWLSDSGAMVVGPNREPVYHVGVARDITEHKRLEEELRRHGEMLERTVAERTARLRQLASELALAEHREREHLSDFLHDDLQQLLVAAKFGAERLAMLQPDGDAGTAVLGLADRVTEALAKVRAFCTGLSTPLLQVAGLEPALRELAGQMSERFGLQVSLELGNLPRIGDETVSAHLFHALRELLFNVVKHAGSNQVRVACAVDGGRLAITVSDDGIGFDPAGAFDGDGLASGHGLFSVDTRVRSLGGELVIASAPGKGTRATVLVPIATSNEPATPAAPPDASWKSRRTRQRAVREGARARILVADDHDLVRSGVVGILSSDPRFEVVGEARNGREAVDLARQLRPDVIVMDIRMPELDGIEATRRVLSEAPSTVVIGVTAFGDAGFRSAMLAAGAMDLLEKEEAGARLPGRIAECLARREVKSTGE